MAMTMAGKGGGGFDVERALNFEKRSGVKDGDIETFITKVDAVNAAIQAMKDGKVDPADVHVDGVPTVEEERQMEEYRRRKRLELAKREQENRERQKKEENDKWWRGAELLYGERLYRTRAAAFDGSVSRDCGGSGETDGLDQGDASCSARSLSEEERRRLKDRYSMEYSRWDKWTPTDPATLAEVEEREEEEDQKRSKEFEESNPDFCKQMVDDMKARSEASDKKVSAATAARLKGNRFYKGKRWEKALDLYMTSLKARPYAVNTLANIAQTLLKLERWLDAVEFCDRALHVDGKCVKALSRRAASFVKLAGKYSCNSVASVKATTMTTAAAATAAGMPRRHKVGRSTSENGALVKDDSTTAVVATIVEDNGTVPGLGDGSNCRQTGVDAGEDAFQARFGGRKGILALALHDLDAAVNIDADCEDIRRQRDNLKKEIEEEEAEAGVLIRARSGPGDVRARPLSNDDALKADGQKPTQPRDAKPDNDHGTTSLRQDSRGAPVLHSTATSRDRVAGARKGCSFERDTAGGEDDDLRAIDLILREALGDGGEESLTPAAESSGAERDAAANDASPQLQALHRLSSVLEDCSAARVYFRASGGLARLAGAALIASTAAITHGSDADSSCAGRSFDTEEKAPDSESGVVSPAAEALGTDRASVDFSDNRRRGSGNGGGRAKIACPGVIERREVDRARFASMLRTVSVALKGGERLAQQEIFKSGLLGYPCARAMQAINEGDQEDTAAAAAAAAAAGAAALLLSRVVEDVSVRTHVAKSKYLLSGLVGLVRAPSTTWTDVEAAASALCAVLMGRTAPIASKTLSGAASTPSDAPTPTGQTGGKVAGWPTIAVGEALLAWREGSGLMKGATAYTGSALCGVLANLAMNEKFRGSFAEPFLPRSAGSGGRASTVAAVLVLVAGDTKAECSEARAMALAALVNACLHNHSAQTATLSAGGLTLALATLSLGGEDRARYAPPLVAARSAALLARLSPLPAAVEAMARPGVFDRIVQATLRSSTLGVDLYTPAALAHQQEDATADTTTASTAEVAAHAIERENLVRTLGSIMRSKPLPAPAAADDSEQAAGPLAPSSNVPAPAAIVTTNTKAYLASCSEEAKLAEALVSFLPPAREDGAEGVTAASVSLRPEWRAPPAVTANVCVCLLHLLDGERSGHVADQVVGAGGIPRLISLFANSGGEGGALSARTNAAICLAKLARKPLHKQMIAELRGMEMLVQAGAGLAT